MRRYHSNWAVTDYNLYPHPPYKGKGWFITFDKDPYCTYLKSYINNRARPAKAVIVHAASEARAQYVADMILASLCLQLGESFLLGVDRPRVVLLPYSPPKSGDGQIEQIVEPRPRNRINLPLACLIATKVSYRKAYQNALFKYFISQEIFSTSSIDLDPSEWGPVPFVFESAEHHTRCAYAIVLAYSVLEELSLELRASRENPSLIDGKWNPKVRDELENRLLMAGVNLSETLLWTMRDTPTRIERIKPPLRRSKTKWARWKIRDSEIEIVDAIAYASWLRSKVSAHRLRDLAASLSYYDVSNLQHLARRLLLEKLGFWRYQINKASRV